MDPNTNTEKNESNPSPTELFSSVQVLGQAAMSAYNKETDKVDKTKAADAAGDLLEAASKYGKLENTSYGQYVEKAEEYLHQYSEPNAAKETKETEPAKPDAPAPKDGGAVEPEKQEESSGGVESYVKIAESFVSKQEGDSAAGESGGGFGGALKMAQGLWK